MGTQTGQIIIRCKVEWFKFNKIGEETLHDRFYKRTAKIV